MPLFGSVRHGVHVSGAVPYQVPLHQPHPAAAFGSGHCGVRHCRHVREMPAAAVGYMLCGGMPEDTGHVRVHVKHTVVDDAAARFQGVLSPASPLDNGIHTGVRLPCRLVLPVSDMAQRAVAHVGRHDVQRPVAVCVHAPLPHDAPPAALWHRLARGAAVGSRGDAGGVCAVLRRVLQLVGQSCGAHALRDGIDYAGACRGKDVHCAASLSRTEDVADPPSAPDTLPRACHRGAVCRRARA